MVYLNLYLCFLFQVAELSVNTPEGGRPQGTLNLSKSTERRRNSSEGGKREPMELTEVRGRGRPRKKVPYRSLRIFRFSFMYIV